MFSNGPRILTLAPEDLPPRVEAWSAIDRLVWQDVDASRLTTDQVDALRIWVGAGGRLVVVGGSTGTSGLGALPADLLPFRPSVTLDASPADLVDLLGSLPAGATSTPALAGVLDRGTVLARSGDEVIAAQTPIGQGMASVVGIDPGTPWLAGTPTAAALWRRLLPPSRNGLIDPFLLQDDSQLVAALNDLPAVTLPDLGLLLALLLLYIALIGPLNYIVLRRLDRREWAWATMPALVLVFAGGAYALGQGLKGTDIVVSQIGIVRGATGSERGLGQFYVGIFSPTRQAYDVRVADDPLLTEPAYLAQQQASSGVPLDVLLGDPATLRGYQVGFGVLRAFRAEAVRTTPRLDADLNYRDGRLTGTLHNRSQETLEHVAVIYGGGLQTIASLGPGESAQVSLPVADQLNDGSQLSQRIFGFAGGDAAMARATATRRVVIDQLTYQSGTIGGYGAMPQGPMVLAWTKGPGIGVDLGSPAHQETDTLLVLPAVAHVSGATAYPPDLIARSVLASQANEATDQGNGLSLSRGTMVVEYRPVGFDGEMDVTRLSLAMMTQGSLQPMSGSGPDLDPLPAGQQPDQEDPVGDAVLAGGQQGVVVGAVKGGPAVVGDDGSGVAEPPAANEGLPAQALFDGLPDLQLYDRVAGRWVEFTHLTAGREVRVPSPERYVDANGAFRARFVNRGDQSSTAYFSLLVRVDGDVR